MDVGHSQPWQPPESPTPSIAVIQGEQDSAEEPLFLASRRPRCFSALSRCFSAPFWLQIGRKNSPLPFHHAETHSWLK